MKYFLLGLLISSPGAWAALNMKPGLWKVDMRVTSDGKTVNPSETMKNAMAKMPEADKKKMMDMMGKMDTGVGPNGETNICYSKKAIDKPETMGRPSPDCKTTLVTNTGNKVVSNFTCKDGTTGDAIWDLKSPENMMGKINVRDPKGKNSEITYDGKFIQADCGKVKPVI